MRRAGFTLIELLIVVAILAILAVVAVPNFLEAQTRAKVARSVADMRELGAAAEAYAVDWSSFPLAGNIDPDGYHHYPTGNPAGNLSLTKFAGPCLTTPVAYLVAQPLDPFIDAAERIEFRWYFYTNFVQATNWFRQNGEPVPPMFGIRIRQWGLWTILGSGPDRDRRDIGTIAGLVTVNGLYDPTNGTLSNGDLLRTQSGTH